MVDQPTVVVRGSAVREVPPELAVFSVTVSARDADRAVTRRLLTQRVAAARAVLDGYADVIEKRETSGVQMRPEVKRRSDRVTAYIGSVSTTVTVIDFATLGDMLLRLAREDQTSVSGPWWQLRPGSRAGADVRRDAVADALLRAREYADAVGASVDRLIEIADEGTGGGGGGRMMRMAAFGASAGDEEPELDVEPQSQTVEASVVMRFALTEPTALKA